MNGNCYWVELPSTHLIQSQNLMNHLVNYCCATCPQPFKFLFPLSLSSQVNPKYFARAIFWSFCSPCSFSLLIMIIITVTTDHSLSVRSFFKGYFLHSSSSPVPDVEYSTLKFFFPNFSSPVKVCKKLQCPEYNSSMMEAVDT